MGPFFVPGFPAASGPPALQWQVDWTARFQPPLVPGAAAGAFKAR